MNSATALHQPRPMRRIWVFVLLFLLSVGAAWAGAYVILRSAAVSYTEDNVRLLNTQVQQRATKANLWLNTMFSSVKSLAEKDMMRLFVAEFAHTNVLSKKLLNIAQEPGIIFSVQLSPDERDIVRRLFLLRRELMDFSSHVTFTQARLLSHQLTPLASTVDPATSGKKGKNTEQVHLRETAAAVLKDGEPRMLPARLAAEGRLIMPLFYPVYPPEYMSEKSKQPLGVLEIFCDMTEIVSHLTEARNGQGLTVRVLQKNTQNKLEELLVTGVQPRVLSQAWKANPQLEAGMRSLPNGEEVFALAMDIPTLPWLAEADLQRSVAEAPYNTFRTQVLIIAAGSTVIIALLLAAVWWWLIGRRERAVAAEMASLCMLINNQKELLDGINGALADGLMLRDARGIVLYINAAFAVMTGKSVAEAIGKPAYQVIPNEAVTVLFQHGSLVMKNDSPTLFTEELRLGAEKRHYQVSSSPYHDASGAVVGVVSVFRDITDLVKAQKRANDMITHTVRAMVRAIEAVDPYLCGQAMSTGKLAKVLVDRLGLSQEHADTVHTAANLSQIGMIRLPRKLLNKQGVLTPEERKELEHHVDYAYEALQGIDFGLPVLPTIIQMYERMDGTGYPKHLQGEQICLDARILAVSSVFCAMMRPRSYRQAHNVQSALKILSGGQFDAQVVSALRMYLATQEGNDFLNALIEGRG